VQSGEGLRRLALTVGIAGALIGGYRAWPQYKIVRERGWHHAYFETQRKHHPKATVEAGRWEVVLAESPPLSEAGWSLTPPAPAAASRTPAGPDALDNMLSGMAKGKAKGGSRFGGIPVELDPGSVSAQPPPPPSGFELGIYSEAFPTEWTVGPVLNDYVSAFLPMLLGFLIPWSAVRMAGWVIHGFQIDRGPAS